MTALTRRRVRATRRGRARGQTLANGLTLRVGTAGTVAAVFKSSIGATAHKVLDLVGYFR